MPTQILYLITNDRQTVMHESFVTTALLQAPGQGIAVEMCGVLTFALFGESSRDLCYIGRKMAVLINYRLPGKQP